jgi:AraC family transcriptional regulator
MELQTHGRKKYPTSALLRSSVGRGWSAIAAEIRSHGIGRTSVVVPQQMELTLAIRGNGDGLVTRTGAGQRQEARPTSGTIWLTPIGVGDNEIHIAAPLPEVMHLFLPTSQFALLADEYNLPKMPAHSIRYQADIRDETISQIGFSILEELNRETSSGRMLVETASLFLAARLVHCYADCGAMRSTTFLAGQLDNVRLRRVLDYIEEHLADEITVADLAKIACLSTYHFTRMFSATTGVPPYRYVANKRLERAVAMVASGKKSLAEIAFISQFSSQASFTRAFRHATGVAPGHYRRRRM